jgi:hypothetical protein
MLKILRRMLRVAKALRVVCRRSRVAKIRDKSLIAKMLRRKRHATLHKTLRRDKLQKMENNKSELSFQKLTRIR